MTENDNSRKHRRGRRVRSRHSEPLPTMATPTSIARSNQLCIEERPVDLLKSFPRNARVHSKKQIHQIAASIREFGFTNPILIDQADVIIAGHGRVEAARSGNSYRRPRFWGESLPDEFSISEICEWRIPETGCVFAETGSNTHSGVSAPARSLTAFDFRSVGRRCCRWW
jgi:ParB-like nuclease domain